MKALSMLVVLVIFFTTNVFAQSSTVDVLYLKNGSIIRGEIYELSAENVKIRTSDGSLFVYSMTEIEKMVKEPIAVQDLTSAPSPSVEPTPQVSSGTSLGFHGGLFFSLQTWNQLADESAKTLGGGGNGNITVGFQLDDDTYIGIGPHFGISANYQNYTIAGNNGTGTTTVQDLGGDIVFEMDGMYAVFGLGSADVSMTATIAGSSETVDFPDPASYKLVGVGLGRGFGAFGVAFVSYSGWAQDTAQHLGRIELNAGFRF